ncbi:hypothetical protein ACFQAS_13280 [Halopenitus salinus]|jgi:hypothetical protein|uniref:DUF7124 domain-containing protein n=1 Tax=Halopenitus salinus TaxID=1198295 RepID=A0ABD5UUH2_9EURY
MDSGGSTDMTLAFELEALRRFADPNAVFNDARQWTEYVGVVSEQPTYVVTNFTRKHRVRQDFFSGPRGVEESLQNIKDQFETDRHVFVGTDEDDEALAESADWEFLSVEDAAEAAGWRIADGEEEPAEATEQRDDWP